MSTQARHRRSQRTDRLSVRWGLILLITAAAGLAVRGTGWPTVIETLSAVAMALDKLLA